MCALTQKIRGKSLHGLHLSMPKRVSFSSPTQRGFSATYPAPILTTFEIKDVNQCVHAYTGKIFQISAQGILQVPKQLKWVLSRGVCDKATAQTAQFRALRIVSGTSQHPRGVPFGYFRGGVCDKATAQIAQFQALRIVSGTSRHPRGVPFMSEFWWGMYGLGAISPHTAIHLA